MQRVFKHKNDEFGWDIKTSTKIKHDKPDMVIWNHEGRQCTIIEFSCPADINIGEKINKKIDNYGTLIKNLQMIFENYGLKFIPIVIGTMGYVPKTLNRYLQDLELTQKQSQKVQKLTKIIFL